MNEIKSIAYRIDHEAKGRKDHHKDSQQTVDTRPLRGIKNGRQSITKKNNLREAFSGIRGFYKGEA